MSGSAPAQDQALPLWSEAAQAVLAGVRDAILPVDAETGVILDANPRAEELFRSPRGALIGHHHSGLLPPDLRDSSLRADCERELRGPGVLFIKPRSVTRTVGRCSRNGPNGGVGARITGKTA